MDRQELMKLYESAVEEELRWTSSHQERVAFYSGLLSAIVAGVGLGLFQASEWHHFVSLAVGTLILYIVSDNAKQGTFREYQRLLEAIVFRAKVEQELGLTKNPDSSPETSTKYWSDESLIPSRHIQSRYGFESSQKFVDANANRGYQGITNRLFDRFKVLSILMTLGILGLVAWKLY